MGYHLSFLFGIYYIPGHSFIYKAASYEGENNYDISLLHRHLPLQCRLAVCLALRVCNAERFHHVFVFDTSYCSTPGVTTCATLEPAETKALDGYSFQPQSGVDMCGNHR